MQKMRYVVPLLGALFLSATPAIAQVSIGIGLPGLSIGINLPVYPRLVQIPGYPVYYAPQVGSNFFFYDGMYWVYQGDNWYASSWYNGPWGFVGPQAVPLFVLRIPVRYYRAPPSHFRGWRQDAPPRWGDHWGNDWAQQRSGWDRWNRGSAPAPAPLPVYQRQYSGESYPHQVEQQRNIHNENYRYQPRDAQVRQHEQAEQARTAPAPAPHDRPNAPQEGWQMAPRDRSQGAPDTRRASPSAPYQQGEPAPRSQPQQRGGEDDQRATPAQSPARQGGAVEQGQVQPARQAPAQDHQAAPMPRQGNMGQDRGAPQEPSRGQGHDKERASGDGQGQGKNR
jgi:hypothetical protein